LAAIRVGDTAAAASARQEMELLAEQAKQYRSVPGKNRVEGQVQIGDGVVDAFIADVAAEHDESLGLAPLVNLSEGRAATQISDWAAAYGAQKSVDGDLYNFSTTSGAEAQPWWQVDLGQVADLESINVYNRVDCCAQRVQDYYVLVSPRPFEGSLAEALADPDVTSIHQPEQAGRPTSVEVDASGRYVRVWLSSTAPTELNMAEVQVFGRAPEEPATD
jgi:hyaluronoglucosaminidase